MTDVLFMTIYSQKGKKIFLRLPFLSYFNVSVCHYLREKKNARHLILQDVFMPRWHTGVPLPERKKYKPLSSAQNSAEGPTPHVHIEINLMSESHNCPVWSPVKANYSLALGPKQKNCKPENYLLKTHPTTLFFVF